MPQSSTIWTPELIRKTGQLCPVLLSVTLTLFAGRIVADEPPKPATAEMKEVPTFADADAARVMDAVRQALESGSRSRFLKLFDARRMPGYAAFRDQVAEFFEQYVGFQVQYHLTQITMDRDLGGLMADVVIDALPADRVTPNVRRNGQLRLVLAWDGKWWRIADWSPRSLLR